MLLIYNFVISIIWQLLKLLALVNTKLSLFVNGRKKTFAVLEKNISKKDSTIWIHAASLGEYEQGLPIMEQLRLQYPNHKLLLTFFSPSGYEIKKNTDAADVVVYLPVDIKKKVTQFLDLARPELAIFIKYEIWPNYLSELNKREIPTLLVSGLFKKSQIYFKSYGAFMRKSLTKFTSFYVQDKLSKELLHTIGINNVSIAGDTRFDRVSEILERDNRLGFMDVFSKDKLCFVAGSTWPEDEKLFLEYINNCATNIKFVIAPHNIKASHLVALKKSIKKSTLLYSEIKEAELALAQVLIIDTIGLLTKIYSYANIAYVGGAFATGLHNTLEPAVFGIPVIIGPNYKGFLEAEKLVGLGGVISVTDQNEFTTILETLIGTKEKRKEIGNINSAYIKTNTGASLKIMNGISTVV